MATPHREDITWHPDALPADARQALAFFAAADWLRRTPWYLAGGTALALQINHRSSVDLDFFTPRGGFSSSRLLARLPKEKWATDILREGTIYGRFRGTKVSFIAYPFFVPRQPYHWHGAVRVLDPKDIAVMKIIAISQRGRKRDFVDLYWYCMHREPLTVIIRRVDDQYPTVTHDYHHIIKALSYFADAEADPMPKIFFTASWPEIKKFFRREAVKAARELLGLR